MLKFQLGTKGGAVENLSSISSFLLSFVMLICSAPAFADDDDYLHHLWRVQEENQRDREFFEKGMGYGKYAPTFPNFCAIAFSKSTHKWGSAWAKGTQAAAEQEALSTCSAPDAEIVCWSKGNWYCALAGTSPKPSIPASRPINLDLTIPHLSASHWRTSCKIHPRPGHE